MDRIAKIKKTFSHRRSKSDSHMFNNWSTACLQPDDDVDDDDESPPIIAPATSFDDPFGTEKSHSPLGVSPEQPKATSVNNHHFFANLTSGLRKKLGSDDNLKTPSSDVVKLSVEDDDSSASGYDNEGLRKSGPCDRHPLEQEPAWVTFDDENPFGDSTERSGEFVEISLEGEVETKEEGTSNRLVQNLKKIPFRFKKSLPYQSLGPEEGGEISSEEAFWNAPVQRSHSLPTSPSMKRRLTSALSSLKRS